MKTKILELIDKKIDERKFKNDDVLRYGMTILKELRKEIEEIEDPIAIIDAMLNEPQHYEVVKSFEELKSRLYPLTQK